MEDNFDKKAVGRRLREFRQTLHMNQQTFADSLNWSNDAYRKIETGRNLITSDKLQQLYALYHIDIGYILTGNHSYDISDDSLLNLHLRADEDQWLAMQMRMIQYYQSLQNNADKSN